MDIEAPENKVVEPDNPHLLVLDKPFKSGGAGNQYVLDLKHVEGLAARGMTFEQIALALGISDFTLRARRKQIKEFSEAIDRGRAKGVGNVTGKLMEAINNGDVRAMNLYLKCQAGWKETVVQEHSGEMKVNINRKITRVSKNHD